MSVRRPPATYSKCGVVPSSNRPPCGMSVEGRCDSRLTGWARRVISQTYHSLPGVQIPP